MNINPVSDVLIVNELPAEEKLASGLYVPGTSSEMDTLCKAEVLAAGPGRVNSSNILTPNEFKVGDMIVYEKRRGLPVVYGGIQYVFINAHQVFGTVNTQKKEEMN